MKVYQLKLGEEVAQLMKVLEKEGFEVSMLKSEIEKGIGIFSDTDNNFLRVELELVKAFKKPE